MCHLEPACVEGEIGPPLLLQVGFEVVIWLIAFRP